MRGEPADDPAVEPQDEAGIREEGVLLGEGMEAWRLVRPQPVELPAFGVGERSERFELEAAERLIKSEERRSGQATVKLELLEARDRQRQPSDRASRAGARPSSRFAAKSARICVAPAEATSRSSSATMARPIPC
jgi:hypothetical protein